MNHINPTLISIVRINLLYIVLYKFLLWRTLELSTAGSCSELHCDRLTIVPDGLWSASIGNANSQATRERASLASAATRRCVYARREVSQIGVSPMHGERGRGIVCRMAYGGACVREVRRGVRAGLPYSNKVSLPYCK